jgi:hypothetical protein
LRVVLQNPNAADGRDFRHSLTVDREYEVLAICANDLRLLNDKAEPVLYDAVCFEVTDATEPSFWVSEFGDEGERHAGPREWLVPGYFEDWHDHIPKIVAEFWADLVRLYPWTVNDRHRGIPRSVRTRRKMK